MGKLTFIPAPDKPGARFHVLKPDGKILFSADTIEGCEAGLDWYLRFFPIDGTYRITPGGGGEIEAVGFGVVTVPSPTLPGQLWVAVATPQIPVTGLFNFTVTRGGGSAGAVAVDYTIAASNGTMTPTSGTVSFAVGQAGAKTVNVSLTGVTAAGTGQITLTNPRSVSGGQTPMLGTAQVGLLIMEPPAFAWDNVVPKQILTVGVPYTRNLNDFITPDAASVEALSGNLAAMNLTLNTSTGVLTGTPTAPVADNTVVFRAIDALQPVAGADAEYALEAGRPGVFYKNNFDFATRAELIASSAVIRYGYTTAAPGYANEDPVPAGTYEKVGLDTTSKLTGRASLVQRFRGAYENLTQAGPSYSGSFGGVGVKGEGPSKNVFFMRYVMRWNAAFMATKYPGTVFKQMIIFGAGSSFSRGEHGFCTRAQSPDVAAGWLVTDSFKTFTNRYNGTNGITGSNYGWHPFMNAGPQSQGALNDTNSLPHFQRRYGPLQYTDVATMADKANYPADIKADREYVILHKIDKVNDEIKIWMAEYGHQPFLVSGRMAAGLSPNINYTGFQCLFRPDDGTNQVIPGGVDLTRNVDQIIVSDNIINFPGGFVPPYAGAGEKPPGYPYLGSYEVT